MQLLYDGLLENMSEQKASSHNVLWSDEAQFKCIYYMDPKCWKINHPHGEP